MRGSKDSVEVLVVAAEATLWPLFLAMVVAEAAIADDGPLGSEASLALPLSCCCITTAVPAPCLVWCIRLDLTLDVGEVTTEEMAEEFSVVAENLVGVTLLSSFAVMQLFLLLLLIFG